MGVSPATGPTPNAGFQAAGAQGLGMVVKQLERLIPQLGATSEPGKAALKALNLLAQHVPAGSVTPAAENNALDQMRMRAIQQSRQAQALKQQQAGAGGPPGGPGGAPPQPAAMPAGAGAG